MSAESSPWEAARRVLLGRREELADAARQTARLMPEVERGRGDSIDRSNQEQRDGELGALSRRDAEVLAAVRAALARIESKEYGRCTECGEELAPARLKARPWAERCVECQGDLERERARAARPGLLEDR